MSAAIVAAPRTSTPRWQRNVVLSPLLVASVLCTLMNPQWATPFTPLLGPWAGLLLGHSDCTLANAAPGPSWAASVAAAAALGLFAAAPRRWSRWVWAVGALGVMVWAALALLSVANTLS